VSRAENLEAHRVRQARTFEEVEQLKPAWERIPWRREEAAYDYFLERARTRPGVIAPYAIVVGSDEHPLAGIAGRIEAQRLKTTVGYKVVYSPRIRLLHIVDGGIAVTDPGALTPLLDTLRRALAEGEADAIAVPPLRVDSELFAAFDSLGGPLQQQRFIPAWARRRLLLPASFDEFVSSRSPNTRWRIRRDTKRLLEAMGPELTVEVLREPDQLERLVHDIDRIARSTYQRALGAGFSDTAENRALAQVGLEHGWMRAYLLYHRGQPIAYWLCLVFEDTMLIKNTGFDTAYADHRVGIYLLMRAIEDACTDPSLRVLDFGPGDAAYKQQFSNETWQERNLVIFAPTFRGLRINAIRTAILGPTQLARRALDRTRLTDRLKSQWRRRLRSASPESPR
jgi:GNAT acetyltransferase-like protein